MNKITLRKETPQDYKQVELLTMRAFWNIHGAGCNEHLLVRILRDSKDYLPELSRIAIMDDKIVGAIFYTKARVVAENETHEVISFGPLAVEPTLQNSGIGHLLMEETFKLAKEAGYPGIIIFGEPEYYPKIGFKHIKEFGITDSEGNTWDAMMAYSLNEKFSQIKGKFFESEDFEKCANPQLLAEIEKEFPKYPKVKIQEGFLQLFSGRFGTVKSINEDIFTIQFWELEICAKLSTIFVQEKNKTPSVGDTVIFYWNKNGISEITQLCKNLM